MKKDEEQEVLLIHSFVILFTLISDLRSSTSYLLSVVLSVYRQKCTEGNNVQGLTTCASIPNQLRAALVVQLL